MGDSSDIFGYLFAVEDNVAKLRFYTSVFVILVSYDSRIK